MPRSLWLVPCALLASCTAPAPRPDFASRDPQERAMAISQAAAENDRKAVRPLIEALDDPDPGLRLLAIAALERITGETRGFDATAPEREREEAIRAWVAWASGPEARGYEGAP